MNFEEYRSQYVISVSNEAAFQTGVTEARWLARCSDLGVSARGKSRRAALMSLDEALERHAEAMRRLNKEAGNP